MAMRKMFFIMLALMGCSAPDTSEEALHKAGFTDVEITGWEPLTCSEDDTFSTGFRARNAQGQMVDGVVCCGLFTKNCTVRF